MGPELAEAGYLQTRTKLADLLECRSRYVRTSAWLIARKSFARMIA